MTIMMKGTIIEFNKPSLLSPQTSGLERQNSLKLHFCFVLEACLRESLSLQISLSLLSSEKYLSFFSKKKKELFLIKKNLATHSICS